MELRVQSRAGRFSLSSLHTESTLSELQKVLSEKTQVPPDSQKILIGYPPKEIGSYNGLSSLGSLNIGAGETLILDDKRKGVEEAVKKSAFIGAGPSSSQKQIPTAAISNLAEVYRRAGSKARKEMEMEKCQPTQVDDCYWIHAKAPDLSTSSPNIIGKWLVFKHFSLLDETWDKIRSAVLSNDLAGCTLAKTSTAMYNPSGGGPGPCTNGVICVYTGEQNVEEVGLRLVRMVQQDIRYKLNATTRSGLYSHAGFKTSVKTIYWNDGEPSLAQQKKRSSREESQLDDALQINVAHGPEPMRSEQVYGKWVVTLERGELTTYWHKLKAMVQSKSDDFGAIKMVCPPRPVFHVFTSKERKDSVGKKLAAIVRRDIEYDSHVSGKQRSSNVMETLRWEGNQDRLWDQEPLLKRMKH